MILLQTFGAVDLRSDGTPVRSVLSQPKRLALLAYLATASPRGFHPRDRLLALFWPDSDDERARNSLRQALHYLRRSLGEGAVVSHGDREVGVDPERVRCDAVAFDDAIAAGRPAEALDLYQGEFLAGLYIDDAAEIEHWIEEQRARYRRAAVEAARTAAEAEERRGGLSAAALIVRRALSIAPHDEAALRHLLELHERSGARAAALQDYEAFAKRFEADLGLEPSAETRAIVDRIRAPEAAAAAAPEVSATVEAGPPVPVAPEPSPPGVAPESPRASASPLPSVLPVSAVPAAAPVPVFRPGARRKRAAALFGALVVAASLAGLVVARSGWLVSSASAASAPAIAVLPFANMSGDPSHELLSDGLAEELMTALARVPGLQVVARTSAFSFKGRAVAVDSIARALRVAHVLEGSVRMTGSQLRVTAKLIDAGSGYQVWAGTYDGELSDVFAVQDSIARAIVAALEPSLGSPAPAVARRPTGDPEAHADVLRGIGALGLDSPEGFARAEEFFRRALERDPDHARAWAGLARVRVVDGYRRVVPPDEAYREARSLAERALALDPGLADAHTTLGRVAEDRDWDYATAERHYRRALELAPGDATALRQLSRLMARLGQAEESIRLSQQALELDPVSALAHRWLGTAYMMTGEHERAVEMLRAALVLSPDNEVGTSALSLSLMALGRHEEAVEAAERALERLPEDQFFAAHAAAVNARAGRIDRARELLAVIQASPRPAFYYRAMIHANLGETDRAFELLDRAIDAREALMNQVPVIPAFDGLRGDPRWPDVLERVGLHR